MNAIKKVLILASAEDTSLSIPINDAFVSTLNAKLPQEYTIEWCNYHDIQFEIFDGKLEAYRFSQKKPITDYDFIYIKSYFRYHEQAAVLACYARSKNLPYVCSELSSFVPMTKLTQFAKMCEADLPLIDTVYLSKEHYLREYETIIERLGSPFIFKSIDGHGGEENYLVDSPAVVKQAIEAYPDLHFIAQKYVPNECDYRVLIVGGQIKLIIKRTRADATHLNNTSQGGHATLVPVADFDEAGKALTLEAARVMKRETAGVDLMFESGSGKAYILEVNASPQIGSGAFLEEKLEIFCEYFKNVLK